MHYFEVDTLIDLSGTKKTLTYHFDAVLKPLSIVSVPFGSKTVLAVVVREVKKPSFKTKAIVILQRELAFGQEWYQLVDWFRSYYPLKSGELQELFLPNFLSRPPKTPSKKLVREKASTSTPLESTAQQTQVLDVIKNTTKPVILHGDMGSGKTLVYLKSAQSVLEKGHSVLLLTPEIGLAEQFFIETSRLFPDQTVSLYHSGRTEKQRQQVWLESLGPKPQIIVGTRSALFLPLSNIGLVCVDEMHENAYKQNKNPRYHAIDVASALAKIHKSKIVFGSATPTVKEYSIAEQKNYTLVRLIGHAKSSSKTDKREFELIDQRIRDNFTRDPYLSNSLLKAIDKTLQNHGQVLIFHNRRGTARFIVCNQCGWSFTCERCESHMVYHHDAHSCRCHVCGITASLPNSCPDCDGRELLLKNIGVKAIEQSLHSHFPSAAVARFDSDNLKSESLANRMDELKNQEVDIIIGTQLIAKGLDLPGLSLVGITNADTSLQLPDYTSAERMFQLVMQATGRVGRGHGDGMCIIQTYQPDNPLFKLLIKGDWLAFYKQELQERQLFKYPPYTFLLKLICRRKTDSGAQKAADQFADELKKISGVSITGPSPAFFKKLGGQYCWQIFVRSSDRARLLKIARSMPSNWQADLDPISLL